MKRRILSFALALFLLFPCFSSAVGAEFSDTEGHWAAPYISQAVSLGLFQGESETHFVPDGTMTRGMFVTVLGRLQGIDAVHWASDAVPRFFTDVAQSDYYAPYITWAVCNGIVDGVGDNCFEPDTPVTREQMAKIVAAYIVSFEHSLLPPTEDTVIPDGFADEAEISPWAAVYVESLRGSGILNGIRNGDGSFSFLPQNTSTRGECAAVFCRLYFLLLPNSHSSVDPITLSLDESSVTLDLGESYQLGVEVTPTKAASGLRWRSSHPEIFQVDAAGLVTCLGRGTARITVYGRNGLHALCEFTSAQDLASADETYTEKCIRVFGEYVSDPRLYYALKDEEGNYVYGSNGYPLMDYEAALADMVSITVNVWDFNGDGEKVTKSKTLKVHKNLADTYVQIFKEIYEGEEQFPIHYLWGYSQGGVSEHTLGTAVDINPDENYYYNPNTGQQVGDYWKPGEDPYSIPPDGDVVNTFRKYGFTQGIYWNSGAKDYMHFSYFAT